jgi:hypothetical protein
MLAREGTTGATRWHYTRELADRLTSLTEWPGAICYHRCYHGSNREV